MRLVAVDRRDDLTWIAIELTRQGEAQVEDGTLVDQLRSDLDVDDSFPIFVPSMIYRKGGRRVVLHLMEGYVFVASGLPEVRYFGLEKRAYVSQIMSSEGGPYRMRVPSVISNTKVQDLKTQLRGLVASDIEVGTEVLITDGLYRGLEGQVMGAEGDDAFILVVFRSLEVIATIPKVFLESQDS
jgi:transcription antitermination factor NusG